jgi:hypothetical protein
MRASCLWNSEQAFRLARAGCRKFFDELNDLGRDLQLQAQKVGRGRQDQEVWLPERQSIFPEIFEIVPISIP